MKKSTPTQIKILFAIFCCFASMASVKAQATFSIFPSSTQSIAVTCDSVGVENVIHISNPTSNKLFLSYRVITNTMPDTSIWKYQFCDWFNCKSVLPSGTTTITNEVSPQSQSASFSFHIYSNFKKGDGELTLNLYETSMPTNSLTITWNASACMSAGISENVTNTSFNVYPNPAQDFVNVEITSGYTKTGSIQVYNFVGDKLMEFNGIKNNVQKIDITKLPAGAYFVKYNNGEGTSVKKIFKTR
jgi:hypothetical protein